jgi:multiple sugar transport system substrate-binding protein
MTLNPGLSIPASQQFDKDVYNKKMITMEWGQTPSGKSFSNLVAMKQAVIFADSTNQAMAKSLLSYIIRPNNLITYLKGAGGRYFPTMPKLLEDPYYKDSQDPHILAVAKSFQNTSSFYTSLNPAYSEVGEQRIWGQAIFAVAQGNTSPEQAADTAINQIKNIFMQWK